MTFNDNVQLDTSQATSGGSSGGGYGGGGNFPGGIQVGGGIGGLILLILIFIFGGNVLDGGGTQDPGTGTSTGQSSSLDPSQVARGRLAVRWGVLPVQDGGRREQERRVPRHRHGQQRSGVLGFGAPAVRSPVLEGQHRALLRADAVGLRHRLEPGRAVLLPAGQAGLHRRELLPGAAAAVRRERRQPRQGVRRGPRVRPPRPGHPRPARPGAAGPARARSPVRSGSS